MIAPKRTDRNHREILDALRDVGAVYLDLHALPGCLDALVGFRGQLHLLEIKDGDLPASRRRLTDAERQTIGMLAAVGVDAAVVTNVEDALRAIGAIL